MTARKTFEWSFRSKREGWVGERYLKLTQAKSLATTLSGKLSRRFVVYVAEVSPIFVALITTEFPIGKVNIFDALLQSVSSSLLTPTSPSTPLTLSAESLCMLRTCSKPQGLCKRKPYKADICNLYITYVCVFVYIYIIHVCMCVWQRTAFVFFDECQLYRMKHF